MTDERSAQAIRRIERAIERIEAAASAPKTSVSNDSIELERLRRAHETLRARVEDAIAELDGLIETEED